MNEYPIFKTAQKLNCTAYITRRGGKHRVTTYQKDECVGGVIKECTPQSYYGKCGFSDSFWFQDLCAVLVLDEDEAKSMAAGDLREYMEDGEDASRFSCYASYGAIYSQIPFDRELQPNLVYIPVNSKKSMKLLKELSIDTLVILEHVLSKKQCRKLIRKYKKHIRRICVPKGYPIKYK